MVEGLKREGYRIKDVCEAIGISRSWYYKVRKGKVVVKGKVRGIRG